MRRWTRVLTTAGILLFTLRGAAPAANVPYLSGGVGADARAELRTKQTAYNLKIVAAAKSGDYLANVAVVIESASKERVLDTTMEGPILLAQLAPGTYTIRATARGKTLAQTVTIPAQGLRQVDFRWDVGR